MKAKSKLEEQNEPLRIMIVDDDVEMGRMIARKLKSDAYTPELFDDPREALKAARAGCHALLITDIIMPGLDGIELMRQIRRFDFDVPIILLTGMPSIETAKKAVELGAFRYLTKPPESNELLSAVRKAAFAHRISKIRREAVALQGGHGYSPADLAGLDVALDYALESLWMAYQPIVRAADGSVFAYESLMRTQSEALPHPGAILSAAETLGRLEELGRRVREIAPLPFVGQGNDTMLFLNLHPRDLLDEKLLDWDTALGTLSTRTVLEITERASLDKVPNASETIAYLRAQRYRIALDDLGSGYAGLTSFAALEPDFVKLDVALVRDVDANKTKQKLIRSVVVLCRDMQIQVVAEGVETSSERDKCLELGVDLLQGFFIARPGKPFPQINW
ncbi:MAG: EAL domain-containing protein [Deltaproteobacteria bacterium]|nr:EAL domain-containing protein [Deltaproteobacteria bacterium]